MELAEAKSALDSVIRKARVHLYKPIQVAEVLHRDRVHKDIDLSNKETFRVASRKWRDDVSRELLGSICTSSIKFQDNIFDSNALPPEALSILGRENRRLKGTVEAYIYRKFTERRSQLSKALDYCLNSTKDTFNVEHFIGLFWHEPGLKRSIDKIYEIVTYALFSTLVDALGLRVEVSIDIEKIGILQEFEDFARKVMRLDTDNLSHAEDGAVYRVGITNAADRGLDMYANWGPAIQIKHLSLDPDLARDIVDSIASRNVVIVCKDAEEEILMSIMRQTGLSDRIQGVVTERELFTWYDKSLHGRYSDITGDILIGTLIEQMEQEFPSLDRIPPIIANRHYDSISLTGIWK